MLFLIKKVFRRVRRLFSVELDNKTKWGQLLGADNFSLGAEAIIDKAELQIREPGDCSVRIGEQSDVECQIILEKCKAQFYVGAKTHLGGGTLFDVACKIEIGNEVLFSFGCLVMDHDSHSVIFSQRQNDVLNGQKGLKDWTHVQMAPIKICDKVWIGAKAIILKGVTIGEGAIIGAGSVVTKDVEPWTVAAGNPARIVRHLRETER